MAREAEIRPARDAVQIKTIIGDVAVIGIDGVVMNRPIAVFLVVTLLFANLAKLFFVSLHGRAGLRCCATCYYAKADSHTAREYLVHYFLRCAFWMSVTPLLGLDNRTPARAKSY